MASSRKQQYIEENAEFAMQQMRRYGIPASVTLAQGILESTYGTSSLCQEANNHFGVKGTYNGEYVLRSDNRPNEKFKKYSDSSLSFEDHSKVLMQSNYQRYCKNLSPTDYQGWARGIQQGGYAFPPNGYADKLIREINDYDLSKYDRMVMEQMQKEGKSFGREDNPIQTVKTENTEKNALRSSGFSLPEGNYSMPVKQSFLLETSAFGPRTHPVTGEKNKMHNGIDLHCKYENLYATEDNGKVISVNNNVNKGNGAGKYVKIEYTRENGSKDHVIYMHMNKIDVKVGDTVNAGDIIGVSGNTGRSTGAHLHFEVRHQDADSKQWVALNPEGYLAEINDKGNLQATVMKQGENNKAHNLLADYKTSIIEGREQIDIPSCDIEGSDWLAKLVGSEHGFNVGELMSADNENGMGGIAQIFLLLYQMFMQADKRERDMANDVINKNIDVSGIVWSGKDAKLTMHDDGRIVLSAEQDGKKLEHTFTVQEKEELLSKLNEDDNQGLSKKDVLSNMLNSMISTESMSQAYKESMSQELSQQQQLQRKQ